jgi:hypothetical protein
VRDDIQRIGCGQSELDDKSKASIVREQREAARVQVEESRSKR